MPRSICFWLPSLTALALSACGGSESGFFSDVVSGAGGSVQAGASARAGSSSSSGSPGSAGSPSSGGTLGSAGTPGSGGQTEAGASSGGAPAGGSNSGGRAGSNSSGGAVATGGGGAAAGHGGGAAAGHGGAQAGSAGSGGSNSASCSELLKQASQQLDEARACNFSANSQQCTGTVMNQCNCEVSVHRDDSAETKAYLATLKQVMANNCVSVCTAVLCKPVVEGQCKQSGSSAMGVCTAASSSGPGP